MGAAASRSGRPGSQNARDRGVRTLQREGGGVEVAGMLEAQPLERRGVPVLIRVREHAPEILVARGSADVLRWAPAGAVEAARTIVATLLDRFEHDLRAPSCRRSRTRKPAGRLGGRAARRASPRGRR